MSEDVIECFNQSFLCFLKPLTVDVQQNGSGQTGQSRICIAKVVAVI